jgi:multiple sugar transport system permease protein
MGRLYVPTLSANTKVNTFLYQTYAPKLPDKFKLAFAAAINILPNTRFRPVTFVGQRLWDEQTRAVDAALRHKMTPQQALNVACYQVQGELDRMNSREKLAPLPVNVLTVVILALCLVAAGYMCWSASKWMKAHRMSERAEAKAGFLFITPWIFGFLILTFGPILCSLILSFCDYDVLHPARWTGIGNYKSLVTDNREIVFKSLWNAFYLGIIGIPLGMITSLAMAILLNVKVAGQKWYRTAFYIPSIVPVVATTVLWAWILNPDMERGLLNACWTATLTQWFGWAAPGWATVPLWAKPALIIMGLWGAGGGMILWLAGLQSIPGTLYEAASIDGAGWWAQFRNITVPMLSPYIFFNLIMGIIGALQTFDTAYIMGGTAGGGTTGPDDSMLTPVIYLFNNAFQYFKMGYASAIAWLLFILILALTLWQLKLAPKWVHYEVDDK